MEEFRNIFEHCRKELDEVSRREANYIMSKLAKTTIVGDYEIELGYEEQAFPFTVYLSKYSGRGKHEIERYETADYNEARDKFDSYVERAGGIKESAITTEITDMANNVIARMLEFDDVIELRTITGTPLGRYVKATNTTTDMMNNALAKGNILVTLIKKQ